MKTVFLFCILSLSLISHGEVSAQKKQRIRFAKGASSATLKGVVRGYECVDYLIGARAGQHLDVMLGGAKIAPVFTIFLPDGGNLESATGQNDFSGALEAGGDYTIRICLMRADARRRNSSAAFTLNVSIQ